MKKSIKSKTTKYFFITFGSFLYAAGTVIFIFPHSILLGGTSGISVVLNEFLPFSPGKILVVINILLLCAAFAVLGGKMAADTFIGSSLTTFFIGVLESVYIPTVKTNVILSAICGSMIIAFSSGILFFFKSSSGGTDIIALIVKKYSDLNIGKCLLITDFVIVLVGGATMGARAAIISFCAFLLKGFGIDLFTDLAKSLLRRRAHNADEQKNLEV